MSFLEKIEDIKLELHNYLKAKDISIEDKSKDLILRKLIKYEVEYDDILIREIVMKLEVENTIEKEKLIRRLEKLNKTIHDVSSIAYEHEWHYKDNDTPEKAVYDLTWEHY